MSWIMVRTLVLQALVLTGIAMLMLAIADTTLENLDRLGVQSGFGFLEKRAGFDINQTLFSYSANSPVYVAFAIAICNTLLLAFFSIILATLVGLIVAVFRISGDWFLNGLGGAFVEIFRNIPALLQIFFWYYIVLRALPNFTESWRISDVAFVNNRGLFLPGVEFAANPAVTAGAVGLLLALLLGLVVIFHLRGQADRAWLKTGIAASWLIALGCWIIFAVELRAPDLGRFGYTSDLVISPELGALILGLSLYNASYVAEVIRSGFEAVPKGQWEAARSLGLGPLNVMRHVVVPQAMRVIVPPMTNCYLNIFKASSLGAAIGYPEIVSVMVGTTNNLVGRPVEIMFLTFSVYSVVSLSGAWLMGVLNRRFNRFKLVG